MFNSHAPSNCKTSTAACYRRHELEKRRAYERRIIEVEHGSFTPIVLSTSGGWGPLATVAFRRLAGLLSIKHSQPYSTTLGFIWSKIAFSLVKSKIMCLQGARSSFHNPTHNTIGGRTALWTSSQTRPGCSIGLAWPTISYYMPCEMLLGTILCFHVNVKNFLCIIQLWLTYVTI